MQLRRRPLKPKLREAELEEQLCDKLGATREATKRMHVRKR